MTTAPETPAHDKCGAKGRSGKPCARPAGWGTEHPGIGRCKLHGGSTPNHQRAASKELARRECLRLGVPIDNADPGEELLGLVREAAGNVEFYRAQVAELPIHPEAALVEWDEESGKPQFKQGEPGVYGRTYHQSGLPTGEAKPHVLVVLYNDERDRLSSYCQAALKAGVEERRVQLAEAEARGLMAGVIGAIQAAALTPEQAETFRRTLAEHLRSLERPGLAGGPPRSG